MRKSDLRRFGAQGDAILQRLRRGPASNFELAQIALKYTSRISDLRKGGVKIQAHRRGFGRVEYELLGEA